MHDDGKKTSGNQFSLLLSESEGIHRHLIVIVISCLVMVIESSSILLYDSQIADWGKTRQNVKAELRTHGTH